MRKLGYLEWVNTPRRVSSISAFGRCRGQPVASVTREEWEKRRAMSSGWVQQGNWKAIHKALEAIIKSLAFSLGSSCKLLHREITRFVFSFPQNQDFCSLWMKTTWQNNLGFVAAHVPYNYETIRMCKLSMREKEMKAALTGRNVIVPEAG